MLIIGLLVLVIISILIYNRIELLKIIKEKEIEVTKYVKDLSESNNEFKRYYDQCTELDNQLNQLIKTLHMEQEKNQTIVSQKKSSETKLGAIAENALPLLREIPYNSLNLRHLGMPIDYVYFDYNGADPCIIFIEVKSGKARESARQKLIKKLIKEGKVYYEELRIDEKGVHITRAKNGE